MEKKYKNSCRFHARGKAGVRGLTHLPAGRCIFQGRLRRSAGHLCRKKIENTLPCPRKRFLFGFGKPNLRAEM